MHVLIEEEYSISERIAAAKIVKQPAFDRMLVQDSLDLDHSRVMCSSRHERHLIVDVHVGQRTASRPWYNSRHDDGLCIRPHPVPRDAVRRPATGAGEALHSDDGL